MSKKCAACGEFNSDDSAFCVNCGECNFDESGLVQCSVCGTNVDAKSVFCPACGEILKAAAAVLSKDFNPPTLSPKQKQEETGVLSVPSPQPTVQEEAQKEEVILCPVCNQRLTETDVFCIRCGTDIASQTQGRITKRKICPHCKGINAMSAKNCTFCFYSLDGADFDDFVLSHEKGEEGDEIKVAVLKSSTNKKSRVCPECGTVNDFNVKFCVKCGMRLMTFIHKKYCYLCGTENTYDAEFCNKCRYSFTKKDTTQEALFRCQCGHLNDKESVFCTRCGAKLTK